MTQQPNGELINNIMSSLTIKEKLSQMFIVGYEGLEPDHQLIDWVKSSLGGIILFRNNIESPLAVAHTIYNLQKNSKIGLFTSIDQEGGLVERVTGMTQVPSFMGIASINDENAVFIANEILAQELKAIGLNLNFTPVVDVNTEPKNPVIGIRSFGDNPEKVAKFAIKVLEAHRKFGVIPTAKHFPGHGASSIDSHLALPRINITEEEFDKVHLTPFREMIKNNVEMIMVCHAFFQNISESKELPASLSHKIITELLINKLNYKGVIITDDLQMNAITDLYSVELAAKQAISAGVDILLYRNYKNALSAYNYLVSKLNEGEILVDRIDNSLRKILHLKSRYGLLDLNNGFKENTLLSVASKYNIDKANELFNKAISIYRMHSKVNNVDNIASKHIFYVDRSTLYHYQSEHEFSFDKLLKGTGATKFSISPNEEEIKNIILQAKQYDLLIVISYNAIFNDNQAILINELTNIADTYILIAGNPYDSILFKKAKLVAMTYGYRNSSIQAFVQVLNKIITGNINFPINIPL